MKDNLPPGVSENQIPGNTPYDWEEEKFWSTLISQAENAELEIPMAGWWEPESVICKLVNLARELEYVRGFQDGKQEAYIDQAFKGEDEKD